MEPNIDPAILFDLMVAYKESTNGYKKTVFHLENLTNNLVEQLKTNEIAHLKKITKLELQLSELELQLSKLSELSGFEEK